MAKLSRRAFLASLIATPIAAKVLPDVVPVFKPIMKPDATPAIKGLPYLVKSSGAFQGLQRVESPVWKMVVTPEEWEAMKTGKIKIYE